MQFDEDVKIFDKNDFHKSKQGTDDDSQFNQEGLVNSALALGASLVDVMLNYNNNVDIAHFDGYDMNMQVRMLFAFTFCSTLENHCITDQLANTALNSFYNTLKKSDADFYEDLASSGAISFYYLALRRNIDVERRMGQTFAMLCDEDGNGVFQELGEALYCKYANIVKKEINKFSLLKD